MLNIIPLKEVIDIIKLKAQNIRILHPLLKWPNKEMRELVENLNDMYHKDYYAEDFNRIIIDNSTNGIICCDSPDDVQFLPSNE